MNFGTVIQSGIKEIGAHWFRSLLTMFGVICGVASLVTMAAFVKGKENLLRESLAETGGLEKITVESEDDLPDYQKHLEGEARGVTLKDVYALQNGAPMVHDITPSINKSRYRGYLRVSRKGRGARPWRLQGTWPSALEIQEHEIEHGRMFTMMDDLLANNVCVIGTEIRNSLFDEVDDQGETIIPIGERILINYVPFTIVGMFKEYMSDEDRKKKEAAKAAGETRSRRNMFSRGADSNTRRTQYIYYQKNNAIMVPLNTLVAKLDSSYETGSVLDRKLSEITMKIDDVSLLSPSLQQVRNVLMRTHKGLEDFEFETQEEFADDITLAMTTIYPSLIVQQQSNTLAMRHLIPRGPDQFELAWTFFGYEDDDDEMRTLRLRQANLMGAAGLVSIDDTEMMEFSQAGIQSALPGDAAVMELGGRDADAVDHLVTESMIRGFYVRYRNDMGLA